MVFDHKMGNLCPWNIMFWLLCVNGWTSFGSLVCNYNILASALGGGLSALPWEFVGWRSPLASLNFLTFTCKFSCHSFAKAARRSLTAGRSGPDNVCARHFQRSGESARGVNSKMQRVSDLKVLRISRVSMCDARDRQILHNITRWRSMCMSSLLSSLSPIVRLNSQPGPSHVRVSLSCWRRNVKIFRPLHPCLFLAANHQWFMSF